MSQLSDQFAAYWDLIEPDRTPQQEVIFHDTREWLLDFAWIDRLVALEVDGGTHVQGKHSRGAGQTNDAQKNNAALALGWRLFRMTTDMIHDDPLTTIEQVRILLDTPVLFPNAEQSMWLARTRTLTRDGMSATSNGIAVKRVKLRKYVISTSQGDYDITGTALDVTQFIMGKQSSESPLSKKVQSPTKISKPYIRRLPLNGPPLIQTLPLFDPESL